VNSLRKRSTGDEDELYRKVDFMPLRKRRRKKEKEGLGESDKTGKERGRLEGSWIIEGGGAFTCAWGNSSRTREGGLRWEKKSNRWGYSSVINFHVFNHGIDGKRKRI